MLAGNKRIQSILQNPWPWVLFGLPALTMVAGVITIVLAVLSEDGLVADDYYKQGLAINQALARDEAAKRYGLRATVALSEGSIRVSLIGNGEYRLPEKLAMRWMHPTQAGSDRTVALTRQQDGAYVVEVPMLAVGRWNVSIEDPSREWRLVGSVAIPYTGILELAP